MIRTYSLEYKQHLAVTVTVAHLETLLTASVTHNLEHYICMHKQQQTVLATVKCILHVNTINDRNRMVRYHCQPTRLLCHAACIQR